MLHGDECVPGVVSSQIHVAEKVWLARIGGFCVRPLCTADQEACLRFGARVDREDLRLRFASPVKLDSPSFREQFLTIDHERLEALAAIDAASAILGVVHLAHTSLSSGDIALVVRSDLKRRGLGRLLLDRVVRHAARLGLAELTADILYENQPMLQLAVRTGFHIVGSSGASAEMHKTLGQQR
jgi:acetyltransferase